MRGGHRVDRNATSVIRERFKRSAAPIAEVYSDPELDNSRRQCRRSIGFTQIARLLLQPWARRPHFIPTSSSWLNQVERFVAEITEKRIRHGVF